MIFSETDWQQALSAMKRPKNMADKMNGNLCLNIGFIT